jgi:hypothetical protein
MMAATSDSGRAGKDAAAASVPASGQAQHGSVGAYTHVQNFGMAFAAPDSGKVRDDSAVSNGAAQRPWSTGNAVYGDLGGGVTTHGMAFTSDGQKHRQSDSGVSSTAFGLVQQPAGALAHDMFALSGLYPASRDSSARTATRDDAALGIAAPGAVQHPIGAGAHDTLAFAGGLVPAAPGADSGQRGARDDSAAPGGSRAATVAPMAMMPGGAGGDGGAGGLFGGALMAMGSDRGSAAALRDSVPAQRGAQQFQFSLPGGAPTHMGAGSDRAYTGDSLAAGAAGRGTAAHTLSMADYGMSIGNGAHAGAMTSHVRDSGRAHDSAAGGTLAHGAFAFAQNMLASISSASDASIKPGSADAHVSTRGQSPAVAANIAPGGWAAAPQASDRSFTGDSTAAGGHQLMRGAGFDSAGLFAGGGAGGAPPVASDGLARFDSVARTAGVARDGSDYGMGMAFGGGVHAASDVGGKRGLGDAVSSAAGVMGDGTLLGLGQAASAMTNLTMGTDRIGGLSDAYAGAPLNATNKTFYWTGQSMGSGNFDVMTSESDRGKDDDGVRNLMRIDHTTAMNDAFAAAHLSTFGLAAPFRHEYKTTERAGLVIPNQETLRLFTHPIHHHRNQKAAAQLAHSNWHNNNRNPVMNMMDSAYESDVAASDVD